MNSLSFIIVSVLSVLVLLLVTKSKKIRADMFLISFFLAIIFGVSLEILKSAIPEHSRLFRFSDLATPIAAAFLYLYAISLISSKTLSLLYRLLLFIPAGVIFVFLIFYSEPEIVASKRMLMITSYYLVEMGIPLILTIHVSFQLRKYTKTIKNGFSNIEAIDFKWLRVLIDSSILLFIVALVGFVMLKLNIITSLNALSDITQIALFIFILFLAYYGIKNTNTFKDVVNSSDIDPSFTNDIHISRKEKNSTDLPLDEQLIEKLDQTIETNKPYLFEKLTIDQLSKETTIPKKQLSQIINLHYNQNFFDFINSNRIKEFNNRIKKGDNEQFTILSIAYECGFSSKSAFNRAYKKHVGVPPSEFAKSGTTS